ncbi:MAG: hypothetical protein H8E59_10265 [Actinobacteria bacterium]|nr:hypothetical protein [Actinomycetota bacterium]
MNIPSLEHAAIGRPITRLGFSLFPVYLPPSDLPPIATGPGSGLIVDELPNASVPTLSVTNPTDRAILLIEGECLVGGAQNRTLNVSVLVPAGATLKIPVTCLEQGRWGSRRAFQHGSAMAPRRVRRTKQDAVAARLVTVGAPTHERHADQGAVWHVVDEELGRMGIDSSSRAMADADAFIERDSGRHRAVEDLIQIGPLPGQCGLVVSHGRRIVATELFASTELLQPHWGAIIRSHLLEHPTADGRPSAGRALRFLNRLATSPSERREGLGHGTEHHVRTDRLVGQALVLPTALIHAGAFAR